MLKKWLAVASAVSFGFALVSVAPTPSVAAEYVADHAHSTVGFRIRHLVAKTSGNFTDYDFKLNYDPAKAETAKVEATIRTKSINTQNEKRDEHLRNADFFHVEKYPTMTFVSSQVSRVAPNQLKVDGTLTMLGVSKPVTLNVEEGGVIKDPWGNTKAGFTATTTINRKDFGMVYNKVLDAGSLMLGEDVEITLEIEANQVQPAAAAPAKKKK